MSVLAVPDLLSSLESVFGYKEFRPHQEDAVRAALASRDCLVVMPTGAGKSLTFQLPAAISEGVTVVISPLIALMRDQILALHERTSFATLGAASLNSSQSSDEQRDILTLLRHGKLKLLYVAPERLRNPYFIETLQNTQIARLVVDEAHCISEWGHDFRPDYLSIKEVLEQIGNPPVFAVTATATIRVQKSIAENLGMRDPEIIVGGFNRPNLHFSVVKCKNELERSNRLYKALPKLAARGGSGLIYVSTRRQCEEVGELAASALAPLNLRAGCYHAGMDSGVRNEMQENWLRGDIPVLVATNAFGMGIDKSDVRFVIHWGYPESPESYYQEAGRAGRDGKKSRAVILSFGTADRRVREFFIENEALKADDLQQTVQKLARVAGDETVRIPRYWWEQEFGWRDPKPRVVIGKLERAGLVKKHGDNVDGLQLSVLEKSIAPGQLKTLERALDREKNERLARLDEMLNYARGKRCRRRILLDYFGDEDVAPSEFCCDVCDARANGADLLQVVTPNMAQGKVDAPSNIGDVYDLLQGLDALWPPVGKARLVKVLRGSKAADVEKFKSQPVFGAFSSVTVAKLGEFLDELIARGLLHQADEEEYYVVRVTRAGRDVWQARAGIEIDLPGRSRSRAIENKPDYDDEELEDEWFEKLRKWRMARALKENVPPYLIFSDKVLREIARQKPESQSELSGISGIGPAKLEKYGEAVVEVLAE